MQLRTEQLQFRSQVIFSPSITQSAVDYRDNCMLHRKATYNAFGTLRLCLIDLDAAVTGSILLVDAVVLIVGHFMDVWIESEDDLQLSILKSAAR